MSLGSTGHPWFCAPPCVYTFYGKCSRAAWCQYCHLEHPEAKRKLSKSERLLMNSLDESMALSVVLWTLKPQKQQSFLLCFDVFFSSSPPWKPHPGKDPHGT